MEPSHDATQTCTLFKKEPSSPVHSDSRDSIVRDYHSERYGTPMECVSRSSSDERGEQMIDIHQDEVTTVITPSRTSLAGEIQHPSSSRDIIQIKQETEIYSDGDLLYESERVVANGLLRPQPMLDNLQLSRQMETSREAQHAQISSTNTADDVAYGAIPDYTPPLSSLPAGNLDILKVDWPKKSFADLSNDPDRHMLHEAELKLAATLDLSCAKYLCAKRRIFQARLRALQAGKEFRRADSQKACKINSNKASKMCRAWEKVGWFDQKYFLGYLKGNDNFLESSNGERRDMDSPSSELTERDTWDVSESEFHFTSDDDEESTDEDTADPIVPCDGRHDEIEGRRDADLHPEMLLEMQFNRPPFMVGDRSQPRVFNDRTGRVSDNVSGKVTIVADPATEDGRPSREAIPKETADHRDLSDLSRDFTDEVPLLETRSMTRRFELARMSHSGVDSTSLATSEAKNGQQHSSQEEFNSRPIKTDRVRQRVPGIPIPHTLAEAIAADIMLMKMREESRPWYEIEEAWVRQFLNFSVFVLSPSPKMSS